MSDSILERLNFENARIFDIKKVDGGFELTEGCDMYFDILLTANELRRLGNELIAIADGSELGPEYSE